MKQIEIETEKGEEKAKTETESGALLFELRSEIFRVFAVALAIKHVGRERETQRGRARETERQIEQRAKSRGLRERERDRESRES